jgi:hypothetical protein
VTYVKLFPLPDGVELIRHAISSPLLGEYPLFIDISTISAIERAQTENGSVFGNYNLHLIG